MREFKIIDDDCVQETDVFKLMKAMSSYTGEVWKIGITSHWLSSEPDGSVFNEEDTSYKYIVVEKKSLELLMETEVIELYGGGKQDDLCSYKANKVSRLYITADVYGCTISKAVLETEE